MRPSATPVTRREPTFISPPVASVPSVKVTPPIVAPTHAAWAAAMSSVAVEPEPMATASLTLELAPAPITTLSSPVTVAPAVALPPPAKLPEPSTTAFWPTMVLAPDAAPLTVLKEPKMLVSFAAAPCVLSALLEPMIRTLCVSSVTSVPPASVLLTPMRTLEREKSPTLLPPPWTVLKFDCSPIVLKPPVTTFTEDNSPTA